MTGRIERRGGLLSGRYRVGDLPGILAWWALGVFLILFHQLCLIPGLLDYSVYGFVLLLTGGGLLVYLLPAGGRREILTFLLATPYAYEAFNALRHWILPAQAAGVLIIVAVIAVTARLYARLDRRRLAAFALAALLVFALAPGEQIRVLNNFFLLEESPNMYGGEVFTYFPLRVEDFSGDGDLQVLSWGNREEKLAARDAAEEEAPDIPDEPHVLAPETVYPYVFTWESGLTRTPVSDLDASTGDAAEDALTAHYPAFPYYAAQPTGELEPLLSPFQLTEGALHFAGAPAMAYDLVRASAEARMKEGTVDSAHFPEAGFRDIRLSGDEMQCVRDGEELTYPTRATEIVAPIQLGDQTGLVLLGSSLQIVVPEEGEDETGFRMTHELTADDFSDVGLVDPLVADVTGDGGDELLLSSNHTPSRILRPGEDGALELLWMADPADETFRFEDVVDGSNGRPEIIAQRPSLIRDDPSRFLTGYTFADGQLHTEWRSMFNMVDVHSRDLTGDGGREIIGLRYGAHRFWVLRQHGFPLTVVLWVGAALLAAWLLVRRVREVPQGRPRQFLAIIGAAAVVVAACTPFLSAHFATYPSHRAVPEEDGAGGGELEGAPSFDTALEDAITRSRAEGRFWYSGWIASFVGKRQVNSMYDGTAYLPHGYVSNVRVAGNPLRVFRWEGDSFLEERQKWFEGPTPPGDGELLADFSRLMPAAEEFSPAGEQSVMGIPCIRYDAEFSVLQWRQLLGEGEAGVSVEDGAAASSEALLEQGSVQVEVLIGRDEPLLHEYRTVLRLPLPGAGETRQEAVFRFYRHGDPNIEPVNVPRIRGYLEEQRREDR